MSIRSSLWSTSLLAVTAAALLVACASKPPEGAPPEEKQKPVWSVATEAETAAALDAKFLEASKSYVKLKKDGVLMFCKKQREIGSNIPTIHCLTEAQLRERRSVDAGHGDQCVGCTGRAGAVRPAGRWRPDVRLCGGLAGAGVSTGGGPHVAVDERAGPTVGQAREA